MSVYGTSSPLSQYAIDPQFATDSKTKAKLKLLGYDQTGQQTGFGKATSLIPGVGVGMNLAARGVAEKSGATDAWGNIKEDTDNRIMKTAIGVAAGTAAVGGAAALGAIGGAGSGALGTAIAANSGALISGGLGAGAKFGGALAFDQNNLVTEGQYIYR